MKSQSPQHFTLYRFWHYRDLLYVGKTTNPPARLKQHRRAKEWWVQITHITMEHHPNEASLHKAECIAILAEKPKHNVDKPFWMIDERRAEWTAKYVRDRWGIPDPDEYGKSYALQSRMELAEKLAQEREMQLLRERKIADFWMNRFERRERRRLQKIAEAEMNL